VPASGTRDQEALKEFLELLRGGKEYITLEFHENRRSLLLFVYKRVEGRQRGFFTRGSGINILPTCKPGARGHIFQGPYPLEEKGEWTVANEACDPIQYIGRTQASRNKEG